MDWINQYRLDNIEERVSTFISNCCDYNDDKLILRRNYKINFLLEYKNETDPLEYLNKFLDDFNDKVFFIPLQVYQYYDIILYKVKLIQVSSYFFDDYIDIKNFLNEMIIKNKCYIFSYKMEPQPTLAMNPQKFSHVIRAFFVNDGDILEWQNEK